MSPGLPLRHLLLALAVVAVWGTNFVVIKLALGHLPPLLFAALRFTLAALPAVFLLPRPAVSWGNLAAYGLLIGVIAMIGLCSMVLLQAGLRGQGSPLVILFGLAMVFAAGLMIFGKLLCLSASSQIPGSGGVLVSLVFDGLAVLFTIGQRGQGIGLSVLANLLVVGSLISFLMFLKGLGEFLERRDIADRASGVFLLGFVLVALGMMQLGLTNVGAARGVPGDVGGIGSGMLGVVAGGLGIFFIVRFAGLLSMCRDALSKH